MVGASLASRPPPQLVGLESMPGLIHGLAKAASLIDEARPSLTCAGLSADEAG